MKIVCTNCGRTDAMPLATTEDNTVDSNLTHAIIKERDWQVNLPGIHRNEWPPHPYGNVKLCPDCQL